MARDGSFRGKCRARPRDGVRILSEVWRAPAKINLWLRVGARRADGYHEIETCYQAIDLCDEVVLDGLPEEDADALLCKVEGEMVEGVPAGEANLAARAARLLADRTGHTLRLALTIRKRIPRGAGLGGGSSDAAAVLVALGRRFAVPDPGHTLLDLARELGADVPFFLEGGTQRATGLGERLTPVEPPPEQWGILVYPGVQVSTGWAYGALDEQRRVGSAPDDPDRRGNDFEPIVFQAHPRIAGAHDLLKAGSASVVRMSGTGSAVFALYGNEALRDAEQSRVRQVLGSAAGELCLPFSPSPQGVHQEKTS